jgi:tetratricopeptide (TPR) repeat protein
VETYDAVLREFPASVEAHIGRGRVLTWMDRNRESIVAFELALTLAPASAEAIRGAAQAEINLGWHRRALTRLAPLLGSDAGADTLSLAARAEFWKGRPDRARILADRTVAIRSDDATAQQVLADIARNRRPLTTINGSVSTQNDGLVISSTSARHGISLNEGLTTLGPQHRLLDFDARQDPDMLIHGVGAFGRHRFNDALELNASVFLNHVSGGERTRLEPTYDTWLTIWPDDYFRFDLSANRAYFDDARSIAQNIRMDTFGLSMDYRPDPDLRLTARGSYGAITDGNRRLFGQLEAEGRIPIQQTVYLGARYTHFNFARPELDHGYFNPDWLHSAELTLRLLAAPMPGWTVSAAGSAGYEWQPGEAKPVWSASLATAYAFIDRVNLSVEIRHQNSSSLGGQGGFRRTTFAGELQIRW